MKPSLFQNILFSFLIIFLSNCGSSSYISNDQINLFSKGTTVNCKKNYECPCYEVRIPELGIFYNSPIIENVEFIADSVYISGTILYQSMPRSKVDIFTLKKKNKIFSLNNNEYCLDEHVGESNDLGEFIFATKMGKNVIFIDQDHCIPNIVYIVNKY
jgi:hypothetical protein